MADSLRLWIARFRFARTARWRILCIVLGVGVVEDYNEGGDGVRLVVGGDIGGREGKPNKDSSSH